MTPEEQKFWEKFVILGSAGMVAGIGSLLASSQTLTARVVFGRALSSVTIGMAAASLLAVMPEMAFEAQVGIACLAASLGTSGLERLLQRVTKK